MGVLSHPEATDSRLSVNYLRMAAGGAIREPRRTRASCAYHCWCWLLRFWFCKNKQIIYSRTARCYSRCVSRVRLMALKGGVSQKGMISSDLRGLRRICAPSLEEIFKLFVLESFYHFYVQIFAPELFHLLRTPPAFPVGPC